MGVVHEYCAVGDLNKLKQIMEDRNVDLYEYDDYGQTPISIACSNNHEEIVEYFIQLGVDIDAPCNDGTTPLATAGLNIIKMLVEAGANINTTDIDNWTPLMYHVTHKDDAAVLDYYLITKGANMHVNTNDGQTLLHLAAKVGHDNNLQYLLMKGLDVDAFDNNNYSAIRYASEADKQTTVRILAEWGASITTQRYIPGTRRVLYT